MLTKRLLLISSVMVRSIFSHSISFAYAACCDPCGLNQSGWRKMRGLGGEGHAVNRPSPTENIAKTAIKAVSPRRLHLTALAASKTRLNIRLREMTNLCRIKRIKRITRPAMRALRMAPGNTINYNLILNLIFIYLLFLFNIYNSKLNFLAPVRWNDVMAIAAF